MTKLASQDFYMDIQYRGFHIVIRSDGHLYKTTIPHKLQPLHTAHWLYGIMRAKKAIDIMLTGQDPVWE